MTSQWAFLLGSIAGAGAPLLGFWLGRREVHPLVAVPACLAYALLCGLLCRRL
jgi:hypothetical protein